MLQPSEEKNHYKKISVNSEQQDDGQSHPCAHVFVKPLMLHNNILPNNI